MKQNNNQIVHDQEKYILKKNFVKYSVMLLLQF